MKRRFVVAALLLLCVVTVASADDHRSRSSAITYAVFGDWPYGQPLLEAAPLLIASINNDPNVSLVIHVGDIHSGSSPCTGAGFDVPPIPTAVFDRTWNINIYNLFQQFSDPLVYTPGDNEWSDCHKKKQFSSGYPMNELAAVRSLFFAHPGVTLGLHPRLVLSQGNIPNPLYPTDLKFVENVMWTDDDVVFATFNQPGGNNDGTAWTAPYTNEPARLQELAERSAANLRWLDLEFAVAALTHAKGVVIATQADMWDPELSPPAVIDGLTNFTPFVQRIADLATAFRRPVLILNGDSHTYKLDHPLADPTDIEGSIHHTQPVANVTRIVVQGAETSKEWLRLTINPKTDEVFTSERIQYMP